VGAAQPSKVDVRIIAATHQPLEQLMTAGTFRRDLYARLAGYCFSLPPLRDRKVDLGVLAGSMIANGSLAAPEGLRIHREALRAMLRYDWPLNIRELSQCLHAASALAGGGIVTTAELPEAILRTAARALASSETLSDEDESLRRELHERFTKARGNVSEVARAMGKARQQIQRWARRFSIDPDSFRR
jgi:transcriptional regulator of acetoin/glycerol metabolism